MESDTPDLGNNTARETERPALGWFGRLWRNWFGIARLLNFFVQYLCITYVPPCYVTWWELLDTKKANLCANKTASIQESTVSWWPGHLRSRLSTVQRWVSSLLWPLPLLLSDTPATFATSTFTRCTARATPIPLSSFSASSSSALANWTAVLHYRLQPFVRRPSGRRPDREDSEERGDHLEEGTFLIIMRLWIGVCIFWFTGVQMGVCEVILLYGIYSAVKCSFFLSYDFPCFLVCWE